MMRYIRIKNWEKHQHYKDRNPPWIKLHREMLTSVTWVTLDDASRALAVACMLLAAATENRIPADKAYIRRVAYLNSDPDWTPLIKTEFLEIVDENGNVLADASKTLACARPETETETDKTIVHSANHSHLEKPPKRKIRTATRFADWWNAYPKKIGKKKCEQIWRNRNLDAMADELISDVQNRMRVDVKWRDGFIPNPQTYLNGDRWQDEIDHQKRAPPKGNGSTDWLSTGKEIGVNPKPGETMEAYARRVRCALDANNRH